MFDPWEKDNGERMNHVQIRKKAGAADLVAEHLPSCDMGAENNNIVSLVGGGDRPVRPCDAHY